MHQCSFSWNISCNVIKVPRLPHAASQWNALYTSNTGYKYCLHPWQAKVWLQRLKREWVQFAFLMSSPELWFYALPIFRYCRHWCCLLLCLQVQHWCCLVLGKPKHLSKDSVCPCFQPLKARKAHFNCTRNDKSLAWVIVAVSLLQHSSRKKISQRNLHENSQGRQ